MFLPAAAAAAAHSQVAEIDSLSKWRGTPSTILSTAQPDLTTMLSQNVS